MCEVEIPSGFVEVLGISSLKHDNFDKLSKLRKKLESKNIKRYRFMPSTIKDKVVLVAEELIEKGGISTPWLGSGFKGKIIKIRRKRSTPH